MSARSRSAFISLALTLLVLACAPPAGRQAAATPTVDSAAVRTAVADFWQRWTVADTAGNVPALMAMVGDSARADLRGTPPLIGRNVWQSFFEPIYKTTKYTSLTITPDLTIPVTSELAYQNGSYLEASTSKGKSMMDHGRYATALRKYPDGQWRFAYIMVFSDSIVPLKKGGAQ